MKKAFALSLSVCVMLVVSISLCSAGPLLSVEPTEHNYGDVIRGEESDPQPFVVKT